MMITHIPASGSYPGMTHVTVNGRTYAALGFWTQSQMNKALGERG